MMRRFFSQRQYTTIKVRKKDLPAGLWTKCPSCNEIIYKQETDNSLKVCPKCRHHFPLTAHERLEMLTEPESFVEWDAGLASTNPLQFEGRLSYDAKLEENKQKTGMLDAVICGQCRMGPFACGIGVMDFRFLGGSMGSVVGEKITRMIEHSTAESIPAVMICASGGARMYEGMLSLMQMAKTSAALARHAAAGLPYISVLTHPTTAGVMASFATLGDVIIAEPQALIGFAGPRVIKETTQEDIPPGFQLSEFVLKHGLIDMIVHRGELKQTIVTLLDYMLPESARLQPQEDNTVEVPA
ncbi:MAG: acetyl-CoA carboxylase, carboxyltransferase subunit beta [Kiritimatiellia bacterium]|nr:acetyl-CoA carboxylase, carboxyltransferase subunit beta [Lentisphaerota bacterium]